ncbi:tocopherol cyclase [Quercus suber]|uniref:Tocopherol cyclase n=1 Tax=Quercus suber TaxID=58331 RepID=A0AAW0M497_QUESU
METKLFSLCHQPRHFSPNLGFPSTNLNSTLKLKLKLKLPQPSSKLGFRTSPIVFASTSTSQGESNASSTIETERQSSASVPLYVPTPPNRELRTPHSGYHFDGTTRKFFEGWYFKVSIPELRQSFCFMYSVENPAFPKKLSALEVAQHGPRYTGVGAQILGAGDKYICQYSEESHNFWGSRHELILGNTFIAEKELKPPNKEVPPQLFIDRSNYVETVKTARWEYSTRPTYGWGWIEWDGERFEFQNAPSYSEKNWGGAFPRKWFWVQCNVFEGASEEVALTIGVHYGGIFYEFVPWNAVVSWEIAPWGNWYIVAENQTHKGHLKDQMVMLGSYSITDSFLFMGQVEVKATTKDLGTTLRAPTTESGLSPACKDTCFGELRLQLWERRYDGNKGKIILDVTSDMAAVEVGGGPWFNTWKGEATTPELLSRALRAPVDVDGIFGLIPLFKPPGL